MNQVIILEGADGSGKSTLAATLARDHGFRVQHTGLPNPRWTSDQLFRSYVSSLYKALRADQPVVFDRHYLGETIYGPVMRGSSLLSPTQVVLLERLVQARGVKVVICLPNRPTALENWRAKVRDYVPNESLWSHIFTAYNRLITTKFYFSYDYTKPHPEDDDAEYYSNTLGDLFVPRSTLPRDVVGSPGAKLLLVGEQVNRRVTSTDWAFFAETGSSGYLNESLRLAGIPEEDLALVNAIDLRDQPKEFAPRLARLPKLKKVVALGKKAQKVLANQQVNHCCLPHPAFMKRFNHAGLNDYANQLKEIYKLC